MQNCHEKYILYIRKDTLYYVFGQTVLRNNMPAVFGMKRLISTVSSLTSLRFHSVPDVMKSEERQKLAKERREEKARYFGK